MTEREAALAAPAAAAAAAADDAGTAAAATPGAIPAAIELGPLLILAPLRIEARALRRGPGSAEVVVSGMGPKAAAGARPRAGGPAAPRPVAVAGFCGATVPGIEVGDVVVATEVRGPGGCIPVPSAPAVAQALRLGGLTVHTGPIASIDHLVRRKERAALSTAGVLAVDMESYWLLRNLRGQPASVVRVVSDSPTEGIIAATLRGSWRKAYRSFKCVRAGLEAWAGAIGSHSVLIAAPRSFCGGVNGAIETTEEALRRFGAPIYVLHEIVHNKHVVSSFQERGVVFVREISDVPEGQTVVFSAHGVGQAEREKARSRRLRVVDATCPLVARVHSKAKYFARSGHDVVLIGKRGHDEIVGVMGEAPDSIHLVEQLEDIEKLDLDGERNIAVLTQTTLIPHQVEDLVDALRQRFPDAISPTTSDICYASQNRQEAVRTMAPQCELLLVLGSPNSSNSKRLVEEAKRMGTQARLVDDESEVDLAWLAGVRTLGLTAGASAPESLVERMIGFIGALGPLEVRQHMIRQEAVGFPPRKESFTWESP